MELYEYSHAWVITHIHTNTGVLLEFFVCLIYQILLYNESGRQQHLISTEGPNLSLGQVAQHAEVPASTDQHWQDPRNPLGVS